MTLKNVKLLKIQAPKQIALIMILKLQQCVFSHRIMRPNDADGMANSVELLHCLLRPVCLEI